MYGSNERKSGLGAFARGLKIRTTMIGNEIDNDNDGIDEASFIPDMQEAGDFIGRLLMSAPVIHMLHLQSDSYVKHVALNDLYSALPESTDTIVEEFQAIYGIIQSYETYIGFIANPIVFVGDLLKFIKQNRNCMGPASSISSSIDLIETLINECLYKLKYLK